MNVLFSCNSKNIVKKYKDERDTFVESEWGRSDTTRMSAFDKSFNSKKRISVRTKSVGIKTPTELPATPKGNAKVDAASNEGGSVSSNPTQEQEGGSAPKEKGIQLGRLLSIPTAQGPATAAQMSRRGSIASNMGLVS